MAARDELRYDERVAADRTSSERDQAAPTQAPDAEPSPRRRLRRVVLAFAAVAAIGAVTAGLSIRGLVNDRADLRDENEALRTALEIARGDAGTQIDLLEESVAELERQRDELSSALSDTEGRLDAALTDADQLNSALAATAEELTAEQELAAELAAELDAVGAVVAPMPDLLGLPLEDAEAFAADVGAVLLTELARPTGVISPPGKVIEQLPAEGVTVVPGSVIWVQVYGDTEE